MEPGRRSRRPRSSAPAILDAARTDAPAEIEDTLASKNSLFVIGRGATFAVAMEAALKLKETSAIHAEAFSSAEVLHGPAGVIAQDFPVLGFAPAPGDAARDGFFETVDRLASFGAAPLVVESTIRAGQRWSRRMRAPWSPRSRPCTRSRAAEATSRRRGRNPDDPPHLMKVTRTV